MRQLKIRRLQAIRIVQKVVSFCIFVCSKVSSTSRGKWLLFYNSVMPLNEFFRNIHITLNSEFLVVQWLKHSHVWITEVYHIHHTLSLQMNCLGNWSSNAGLIWTNLSHTQRRSDLHGVAIKSGFINFVSRNINIIFLYVLTLSANLPVAQNMHLLLSFQWYSYISNSIWSLLKIVTHYFKVRSALYYVSLLFLQQVFNSSHNSSFSIFFIQRTWHFFK